MIELTRLNNKKFILNSELIETIEVTPDTVITLRNGKILIVAEPPEKIAELVLAYRRSQYSEVLSPAIRAELMNMSRRARQIDEVEEGEQA